MQKKLTGFLAILMVTVLALGAVAMADTTIGQALYAAHGSYAFCVATVSMEEDVITAALIEEFQFLSPDGFTPVPNSDTFTNDGGNVLASKRLNSTGYSDMMKEAGSTQPLLTSYKAIEDYVIGKTIEELEAEIDGKEAADVADAVTSSTLVDTLGYIEALIEAAKNAA